MYSSKLSRLGSAKKGQELSKLKESIETWKLNAMYDPGTEKKKKKEILWNPNKPSVYYIYIDNLV